MEEYTSVVELCLARPGATLPNKAASKVEQGRSNFNMGESEPRPPLKRGLHYFHAALAGSRADMLAR